MKILLWIVQVLLAVVFFMAGSMKAFVPLEELIPKMAWMGDVPEALVRFLGWAEMVGALGLILPAATRIKPFLTPLAAAGLATVMFLATSFHLFRGEIGDSVRTLVLLVMTALVAYGRWKKAPIEPR